MMIVDDDIWDWNDNLLTFNNQSLPWQDYVTIYESTQTIDRLRLESELLQVAFDDISSCERDTSECDDFSSLLTRVSI